MITLTVFIIGVMLRITKWVSFGFPRIKRDKPKSNRLIGGIKNWTINMIPPWDLAGRVEPVEYVVGITMHVSCILILLGAIHVASVQNIINIPYQPSNIRFPIIPPSSLPISIPRWLLTYIVTPIFLSTLALIIIRRLYHRFMGGPQKSLTTRTDWIAPILLWLAAFTGILAVLSFEPYTTILTMHLILTQLFIMYLPFSKLIHGATVFLVRTWSGFRRARYGV